MREIQEGFNSAIKALPKHHPNICEYLSFDFGIEADMVKANLVTKYCSGRSLETLLEQVRQLRHHFGPFLARFSAPPHPTRAVGSLVTMRSGC